jgi:hypothetical protein
MWHVWGKEKRVEGFGGETRRKKPLGKCRRRSWDNIRMGVKEN